MARASMSDAKRPKMRVVVFKDGDLWVAQALEYDICAQGQDLKTVRKRLQMSVRLEHEKSIAGGKEPFHGIGTAPKHFQDMWSNASDFSDAATDDEHGIQMKLCA